MNENIDLTKILEGCEGIELYTTVYGYVKLNRICLSEDGKHSLEFKIKNTDTNVFITERGFLDRKYPFECIVFPSKDQRDWSKFKRPLKKGTPVVCSDYNSKWYIAYYSRTVCNIQFVTLPNSTGEHEFNYVIPFDKFNPNNIEDSIKKYNIQKL